MKIDYLKRMIILLITLSGLFACSFNVNQGGNAGGGEQGGSIASKEKLVVTVTNVGESNVELSWNALEGVSWYAVMFSISENGYYRVGDIVEATSGSVKKLLPDKTYYFKVVQLKYYDPFNFDGIIYGLSSAIVKAKTQTGSLPFPVISGHTSNEYSVTLNWNAVAGATSYLIYRMDFFGGEWSWGDTYDNSLTYKDDSTVEAGQTYIYKIVAYNGENNRTSAHSSEYKVVIDPPSLTLPEISYNLTSYDIGWNFQPLTGGLELHKYEFLDPENKTGYSRTQGITEPERLRGKNIESGKTYYFRFRLFDEVKGQSSVLSNLYAIAVPQPEFSAVPGNFNLDNIAYGNTYPGSSNFNTEITISWEAVQEANTYYIYGGKKLNDIEFIGSTSSTTFTHRFHGWSGMDEFPNYIRVKAVNTTTKQSGPLSAPIKVIIK